MGTPGLVQVQAFPFDFDPRVRSLLRLIGVTPSTALAVVGREVLRVRFGPYLLDTTLDNVADVTVTGPYRAYRAIGPRLSLADRGVTFGTNARSGVCVRFRAPVGALAGARRLRHPGMTVTLADPHGFADLVRTRAGTA